MIATARNQSRGRPRSRFFAITHRIADRFGPAAAAAFIESITRLQEGIDAAELRSAIAAGSIAQIESAVSPSRLQSLFAGGDSLQEVLTRTAQTTGRAGADVLTGVLDVRVRFNALDPNVVMFARQQSAQLVVAVTEDVREAIRIVTAVGSAEGLTTVQQARAIREIVGLPPNWARAPLNLRNEILEGNFNETRRLSATDKAQIRSRIARGTVTEEFADRMQTRYSRSLLNRRAQNIARTETIRSGNHGQHEGWRQAINDGHLPDTARRHWVVTPDDLLEHWMVPGMNSDGRGMDEMFDTPEGPVLNPPSRTNCRCGVGLSFPGLRGVL
jgi:hypothetical protein